MKFEINLNTVLLLIGIGVILWFLLQKPKPGTTEITNKYDSTIYHIHVNNPKPQVIIQQSVPQNVDTQAILEQFFTLNTYRDTIKDSCLTIYKTDTIGFNRLLYSGLDYKWTCPVQTIIKEQQPPRIKAYGGAFGLWDTSKVRIGLSFSVINRRDIQVTFGKSLTSKDVYVGISKKISLR